MSDESRAKPRAAPPDPSDLSLYDLGRELFRISNELQKELEGGPTVRVPSANDKASRLARLVGRDGWKNFDGMTYAVLGGEYEKQGLLRTVKHHDHTRTYALTEAGRAFVAAGPVEGNAAQAAPSNSSLGPRRPCRVCGDGSLYSIHPWCERKEIESERDKNDEGPAGGCPEEES